MSDNRNVNITNKVFEVLNNTKNFEVALSNPQKGILIVNYQGTNFYLNIEPMFNDNPEGNAEDAKPFAEVVRNHTWVWK